jgi:hypothetical protein
MSNELKHADVIVHMAKNGFDSVEGFVQNNHEWFHGTGLFNPFTRDDIEWRIKPATITYTVTVEPPMRVMPNVGDRYFGFTGYGVYEDRWDNDAIDKDIFALGNIWDTEAKAQAAFDALFSPLRNVK